MIDILFNVFGIIIDSIHKLLGFFLPPLKIEVVSIDSYKIKNDPNSRIVDLNWPRGYSMTLRITNNIAEPVTIRAVDLFINKLQVIKPAYFKPIRLEPRDYCEQYFEYHVPDAELLNESGIFKLIVTPAVGKLSVIHGNFPLKSHEA